MVVGQTYTKFNVQDFCTWRQILNFFTLSASVSLVPTPSYFDGLKHHVCEFCMHCREAVWVDGVQKKMSRGSFFFVMHLKKKSGNVENNVEI